MLRTIMNRKRLAGVATLAGGLAFFAAMSPANAWLYFLTGTGTASAWDKALAHDLAFRDAVATALKTCTGTQDGGTETKVTYETLPSGQWQATVAVRAACNFLDGDSRG